MKKKPHEYANDVLSNDDYLKKLLDKIDDGDREAVLGRLGEKIMAREDYSRGMDELREKDKAVAAYKGELDNWYSDKLETLTKGTQALTELEKLKKAGTLEGGSKQLQDLEGYVKKDDVEKFVAERLRNSEEIGIAVMTQLGSVLSQHQHLYGEPLDTSALIAHAKAKGKSIQDAWSELTADKRQALEEKRTKAEREKLRSELRAELQKEMGHGVYPVGPSEDATSPTLAALGFKKKDGEAAPAFGVAAAVDEYWRSQKPPSA